MSDRLKGKVAIVTGSGQGIGRAIALAMAKEGAKLVTNNRRPGSTKLISRDPFMEKLNEEQKKFALAEEAKLIGDAETTAKTIRDMGGEAVPFFGDVADYETAGNLIKTAVDKFGKVDILVNNAGNYHMCPIWEMTEAIWYRLLNAHVNGTWNCVRQAVGLMKEQKWGRIINCSSVSRFGMKYHSNYSASKGAIVSFTRAIAKDLWEFGITVNAYAPGAYTRAGASSAMHALVYSKTTQTARAERLRSMMAGQSGEEGRSPEMLAPFIAYLATQEAANISGSVFGVHGNHIGLYSEPTEIAVLDKEKGLWTVDELIKQAPKVLFKGYKSKAPLSEIGGGEG